MKKEISLYVHIPFCVSKCNYCDFCSFDNKNNMLPQYLEAMKKEIKLYKPYMDDYVVSTIFFGGGTPTVLKDGQIEDIMKVIKENYEIKTDAEITIEANPKTVNLEKLEALKKIGFNRISMGMQSANENTLKILGRIHTLEDVKEDVNNAKAVGFNNMNLDIMFSLPNETKEDIEHTIDEVLKLDIPHISAYSLILEEGTPLEKEAYEGVYNFPDEDEDRYIYYYICDRLKENGYVQYEISNFAKPGYESKHNMTYWKAEEYLGIGLGAHSYLNDYRFGNVINIDRYISKINDENKIAFINGKREKQTEKDKMGEFMFLGLRMLAGIDTKEFDSKFSRTFEEVYGDIVNQMLDDEVLWKKDTRIGLTRRGIDVSNMIFAEFMQD